MPLTKASWACVWSPAAEQSICKVGAAAVCRGQVKLSRLGVRILMEAILFLSDADRVLLRSWTHKSAPRSGSALPDAALSDQQI